jgi:hypothetical protein
MPSKSGFELATFIGHEQALENLVTLAQAAATDSRGGMGFMGGRRLRTSSTLPEHPRPDPSATGCQ